MQNNKDTSINTNNNNNKQFWLSVEKIRKFKERALQLDKIKTEHINQRHNSPTSIRTVQLSASQRSIKAKALINKKRKLQPLDVSPNLYINNAVNKSILTILKKEMKHKMNKLPPITTSIYNHLCNYNHIHSTISFDKLSNSESSSPIKTLKPIDDTVYKRLLNNKICIDEVKNSPLLIQSTQAIQVNEIPQIDDVVYKRLLGIDNKIMLTDIHNDNNNNNKQQHYTTINTNSNYNVIKNKQSLSQLNLIKSPSPSKSTQVKQHVYKDKYIIFPGNNSPLIKKCMERRSHLWESIDKELTKFASFIWSPLSNIIDFNIANSHYQTINHFEFNYEINNKMRLFANILRYCETTNPTINNIFSFFPLTIIIPFIDNNTYYNDQLLKFKHIYTNINNIISTNNSSNETYADYFKLFIYSKRVGQKTLLDLPDTLYAGKNLWIIKPTNYNRGRKISVENDINNIETSFHQYNTSTKSNNNNSNSNTSSKRQEFDYVIIQKYIEKPLLYGNRKFDIRIWVLYISDKPNVVYIFKEGHLKATCQNFTLDSNDGFIHLTNYSVQKYHDDFSKLEKGNEISYKQFQEELNAKHNGIDFRKEIYPKICNIIKIAFNSVKDKINLLKRTNCFELFGCDFLIDEKYNPFLIEINTNPGLEESSPLIAMLTPRLIDDLLKLTIDVNKDKKVKLQGAGFHVDGYDDNENLWEEFIL